MTPRPDAPDPDDTSREPPRDGAATAPDVPGLSLTQIVASALAAVSATVLLSYFGIAGTIIGAGVASVITVVANYVYARSIATTRKGLKPVVGQIVHAAGAPAVARPRGTAGSTRTADPSAASPGADVTRPGSPGTGHRPGDGDSASEDDSSGDDAPRNPWLRLVDRYGRGKVLAATSLALFIAIMGVVLVVELVIGKPISDAVRGQEGSGTSISQDRTPQESTTPTAPPSRPAENPTAVPSDEPSGGSTQEPDDPTPAETPSVGPTPSPGPTATPDPAPTTDAPETPGDAGLGDAGDGG